MRGTAENAVKRAASPSQAAKAASAPGHATDPVESRDAMRAAIQAAMQTAEFGAGAFGQGVAEETRRKPSAAPTAAETAETGQADSELIEIHPDLPRIDPHTSFGATMALWRPPRFTPWEILDTISEILQGTGATAEFDPEMIPEAERTPHFSLLGRRLRRPPRAMLRINGLRVLVGGGDRPAFTGDALAARVNPALWAEGVQRLSASRGHVAIADAHPADPRDIDLSYDRAVAVTVTAAAVSLLTEPCGIIWHPAGNATPPDVIPDFIQSLVDGVAPLPLWLRWLLIPPAAGHGPGVASRGLEPLLGREIEIVPAKQSLEKSVAHLFEIAHRQVLKGRPIPDATEVGTKDRTWYFAVHADEGEVVKGPVFRLTPVHDYTGGVVGWQPI